MSLRTWHIEAALALLWLAAPVLLLDPASVVQWTGVAAVWVSFMHGQVSDRLAEKQAARAVVGAPVDVECWRFERRYFIGKEFLWVAYFGALHAWPALAGAGLFLAYRAWRTWYRRPKNTAAEGRHRERA